MTCVALTHASHLPRLNKLLGDVVISQGGVVPFINPELLPTRSKCVSSVQSMTATDCSFRTGKKEGASQEV